MKSGILVIPPSPDLYIMKGQLQHVIHTLRESESSRSNGEGNHSNINKDRATNTTNYPTLTKVGIDLDVSAKENDDFVICSFNWQLLCIATLVRTIQ